MHESASKWVLGSLHGLSYEKRPQTFRKEWNISFLSKFVAVHHKEIHLEIIFTVISVLWTCSGLYFASSYCKRRLNQMLTCFHCLHSVNEGKIWSSLVAVCQTCFFCTSLPNHSLMIDKRVMFLARFPTLWPVSSLVRLRQVCWELFFSPSYIFNVSKKTPIKCGY